jgi:hypothetical protein
MKALSVLRIHRCSSVPADCTIRHHSWDSGGCSSESDGYNFRRRSLVADGYSSASRGCSSDLGECSSEPDGYSCCRSADCTSHWNRSSVADGCTNRSHIRGCSPGRMARAAAPRSDCFPQSGNSTGCSRTSSRSGRLLPQAVALTARRSHHVDYFQLPDGPPLLFAARPKPPADGGRGTERDHAPPAFGDIGPRSAIRMLLLAAGDAEPRFGISIGRCTPALLPIGLCTPALFIDPAGRCAFPGPFGRWAEPFHDGRDPIP